jgi:hypothetical protein
MLSMNPLTLLVNRNFKGITMPTMIFITIPPAYQCCGSGMFITDPGSEFFHPVPDPGSRVKKIPDSGSGSLLKNLSIFNPKIVSKHEEIFSGMSIVHPGSGS